jgi:ribosomal protein S18 acetylase RimI-like enzyme
MTLGTPRPVQLGEYDALAALWHGAWHDGLGAIVPQALVEQRGLAQFRNRLDEIAPLSRVIGPVGAPLGFCTVKGAEINQLFVAAEARGTGLAVQLLQDGENRIARTGRREAVLDCHPHNHRAMKFYMAQGWRQSGIDMVDFETEAGPFPLQNMQFRKRLSRPTR